MSEHVKQSAGKLIFVIGNARSGTTMMGRILGNHPSVYTFHKELHFFEKLWTWEDRNRKLSIPEALQCAAKLSCIAEDGFFTQGDHRVYKEKALPIIQSIEENALDLPRVYAAFLKHISAENGKSIPCEQTPGYVYYIREILELFPEAKLINMVRDPRDILLSQKKRWKRFWRPEQKLLELSVRTWMNYHPISTSRLWNAAVSAGCRARNERKILSVRYEDIVKDPEKEIKRICAFIGISYNHKMLEVPMVGSSLISDTPEKTGIDRKRTANWKEGGLNSAELFLCQMLATHNMKRFGYKDTGVTPNPIFPLFYCMTFLPKLVISLFLHVKYIKNLSDAVSRRLI